VSKAAYLADLRRRMQDLEARMAADKRRLTGGTPRDKVRAAGDLAVVESRLAETKKKLSRLESEPEGAWENFKTEIAEDLDYIERDFERWLEKQG
jgi:hypothetical protein